MIRLALAALVLSAPLHAYAEPSDAQTVRRYAFVVGSNDGGKERVRLRYANSDAGSLARVMLDLGGVQENDLVLLRDATEALFRNALDRLKQRIAQEHKANERAEFLLYYSGHSDEEGLLLAGRRLEYRELRALVSTMPVDVKIAIVDSCASGALVRLKGGERRAAFLVDASASARGHAFITSSSADEAAQESDRIAGSFFTHYLISGLRGAADTTGDKRVTLNEAYQFAFNETLHRTERTQSGPQHPSYDIQLAGAGDLVMTDVRSMHAGIVFDEPVDGRLFVRDENGRLIVELDKPKDRRVEIGLAAGKYAITREHQGKLTLAQANVASGQRLSLDAGDFSHIDKEMTVRRGDDDEVETRAEPTSEPARPAWVPQTSPPPQPPKLEETRRVRAVVGFAGPINTERRARGDVAASMMFTGLHLKIRRLDGVALGLGINHVTERVNGAMFAGLANLTNGRVDGVQFSLGANISKDWIRGVQASPFFNFADALTGAQLGTVNVVRGMRGFQLGLVNYASNVEKGFQLGLINIAKSSEGGQLGLFSYAGNVPLRLQIYTSDINAFNVGLRYGSKYLYGIALGGLQPFFGAVRGSAGLGLGVHAPFWHLYFDVDASAQLLFVPPLFVRTPYWLFQARALLGGQIVERFGVFVGATLNLSFLPNSTLAGDEALRNVTFVPRTTNVERSQQLQIWPGFIAGIQI